MNDRNRTGTNSASLNEKQGLQENQGQDASVEVEAIVSHQTPKPDAKRDLRLDRKAPVSPVVNRLAKENGVDWIIWRIFCGLEVSNKDINQMGNGGLL